MTNFESELFDLISKWRDDGATLDEIATGLELARYALQEEIDAELAE